MRRFSLAVVYIVAVLVTGCSGKTREEAKKTANGAVVKGLALETVQSAAVPEMLEVAGTVRARTSAVVSARIPGSISVLSVREGDRVRKGQLLAQLEAQENQATAAAALAGIDEAKRGLDEALSRKRLADATFERYHKLFNEQAVTRQEFEIKQSEKEVAAQGAARAEARLKQAQEGSRGASIVANYTRITAPISGIVTSKSVDLGATVFPAQPLLTVEDEGSYQLELAIPESLMTKVRQHSPVQVTLDALGSSFPAGIAEIVPAADPASRTFIAKILLGRKGLRSGMFGRGTIALGTTVNGITLPRKAVVEHGALTSVWAVEKNNIARMRIVKTGKLQGERIEILSGLSDGERVVVGGVEKVTEGTKVE